MKKILLLISGILSTFILIIFIFNMENNHKIIHSNENKQIINTNSLTMMYETDYQSGEYQVSNDNVWPQDGYIFNETLSKCENNSKLTWDDENKKILLQTNTSDKCYVYFDKEPLTLANHIINNVYVEDGENGLYYHDGQGSYTNSDQEAGDNSYRYARANPNNYVCFGSNETTCPDDNLYRIIGVFDGQVKLIKADYATTNLLGTENYISDFNRNEFLNYKGNLDLIPKFSWGEKKIIVLEEDEIIAIEELNLENTKIIEKENLNSLINNIINLKYNIQFLAPSRACSGGAFSDSSLNIDTLNKTFKNTFDIIWQDKIYYNDWQSDSSATNFDYMTANEIYQYENGINKSDLNMYNAKIGLMYASDYLYGAIPENWENVSNMYSECIINNWLYLGVPEFLNMGKKDDSTGVMSDNLFYITSAGNISSGDSCNEGSSEINGRLSYAAIRPTFYLNVDVIYTSGDGTQQNPYRIA